MFKFIKEQLYNFITNRTKNRRIENSLKEGFNIRFQNPNQSYNLANKVLDLHPTKPNQIVETLILLASYWNANDNYNKAEHYYLKAYEYKDDIPVDDLGILSMEIGTFYNTIHKNETALFFIQQAENIFSECNDILLLTDLIMLKADLYWEMGDLLKAQMLLEDVLTSRERIKARCDLIMPFVKLIDLFLEQRDLKKGEKIIKRLNSYLLLDLKQASIALISIIDFYRTFKKFDKIKPYIQLVEGNDFLKKEPDLLFFLFQYYVDIKSFDKALVLFTEIEQAYRSIADKSKLKFLFLTGLRLFSDMRNMERGTSLFHQYLNAADQEDRYAIKWLAHSMYGQFLYEFDEFEKAISHFYLSASALEEYRNTVPENIFDRISFFSDKVGFMNRFCSLALEQSKTMEGFYFLENAKSKTLLDLLATNHSLRISSFEEIKESLLIG